jgi:hypothetical protein
MFRLRLLYASMALAGACCVLQAQSILTLPEASQRAVVGQRVGLTDITITYHRPLAGERKIWGGIVPYGQVWRAGANENTTIEFSTAVSVEGQPLAKGILRTAHDTGHGFVDGDFLEELERVGKLHVQSGRGRAAGDGEAAIFGSA